MGSYAIPNNKLKGEGRILLIQKIAHIIAIAVMNFIIFLLLSIISPWL